MATTRVALAPEQAQFLATAFPQFAKTNGTNLPVMGLAYDTTTQENAFWQFVILGYGSGSITATVYWYADTATTGGVAWGGSLRALTPDTDTQDVETDALATEIVATDTHLGTVGQRVHQAPIVISNLDAVANLDLVTVRISRIVANAGDTMAGDAIVVGVVLSYSDV
jgi:hypothetical protein